jgi:DNA-binding CsgD family transcriptional regulator
MRSEMGRDERDDDRNHRPPAGLRSCRIELEERDFLLLSFPLSRRELPASLTSAERDVIRLVLSGCSNAEVARARGRSPRTVANQLASIFRKLGIASRTELAECLASTELT